MVCWTIWILVAGFLCQDSFIPVMSINGFEDQENFFFPAPDPHTGTVPSGSHGGSPPTHETPSHGSGGGYHPTPTPSHGSGGGYHPTPTPSTPSDGDCGTPPHERSTPSRPSPSHGGYNNYHSPPTPATVSPPSTPINDPPGTPHLSGTCDFWRSHPTLIWGLLGWWGNVGSAFGVTSTPGFGSTMSLPQSLSNTRNDGFGALYREGTASFLNSMVNKRFPFSTKHVRESFVAALSSNSAAAAQAHLFKLANEGNLKPRD
ncbi:Protodermal factor 1 [Hibiscus syriacus]|uniref:Protodermal factor 1 n=2 Tax=Hibiscus syriacus TaxID=106335 RepID=A0A6A2ZT71_HIBSY|nr:Protodermal factor 1 [Hibiscus syriacus]